MVDRGIPGAPWDEGKSRLWGWTGAGGDGNRRDGGGGHSTGRDWNSAKLRGCNVQT